MFLKLSATTPHLSWVLHKNPGNIYDRNMSGGRRVLGFFEDGAWCMHVKRDPAMLVLSLKEQNLPSYVTPARSCVCPAVLAALFPALRSAMLDNAEISETPGAADLCDCRMLIGPFATHTDGNPEALAGKTGWLVEIMNSCGLEAAPVRQFGEERFTGAFALDIKSAKPMTVKEFVGKIWLLAHLGSWNDPSWRMDFAQLEKFGRLMAPWIEASEKAAVIKKKLARMRADAEKVLDDAVREAGAEQPKQEDAEHKMGLHAMRHALILPEIPEGADFVLDLGCAGGRLSREIAKAHPGTTVIGIDAGVRQGGYAPGPKNLTLKKGNILYPDIERVPDVVILTEVIEHLDAPDRTEILRLVAGRLRPARIIITVPNVAYNPRMGLDGYRHKDHRIEYTQELFQTEVAGQLAGFYTARHVPVRPDEDGLDPVIMYVFDRRAPVAGKPDRTMHAPFELHGSGMRIEQPAVSAGLAHRAILANRKNIFWLGPTIAPCDTDHRSTERGLLEHPSAALRRFARMGVDRVSVQKKHMGSRASILCFKDQSVAANMGMAQITMNTRQGMPFFKHASDIPGAVLADLTRSMRGDFIMLDSEVEPWRLLGSGLIHKEFTEPGEALLMDAIVSGDETEEIKARRFMEALMQHGGEKEVAVKPFCVLAEGVVSRGKLVPTETCTGVPTSEQMARIEQLAGDVIRPCEHITIGVDDEAAAVDFWERICAEGGEGVVIKPEGFLATGRDGTLTLPAIKVRGAEYLRIIYGPDYLDPDILEHLSMRKTRRKRSASICEHELSIILMHAFMRGDTQTATRAMGAFHGYDDELAATIDATL